MNADFRLRIPEHVMIREVGGESVLLDLETERYFGLDEVGTEVLRYLSEGSTVGEAVERIVEDYDASSERVSTDIEALLESLLERGLVSVDIDNG